MIYDFSSSFEQFWLLKSFISDYIYFEEKILTKAVFIWSKMH